MLINYYTLKNSRRQKTPQNIYFSNITTQNIIEATQQDTTRMKNNWSKPIGPKSWTQSTKDMQPVLLCIAFFNKNKKQPTKRRIHIEPTYPFCGEEERMNNWFSIAIGRDSFG